MEDIARVPGARRAEVRFQDLNADPMAALSGLYAALGWDGFESVRPAVEAYHSSLRGFKMNEHKPLSVEAKAVVRSRWRSWFEDLRYDAKE